MQDNSYFSRLAKLQYLSTTRKKLIEITATAFLLTLFTLQLSAQQTFQWGVKAGGTEEDVVNNIICTGNDIFLTGKFAGKFSSGDKMVQSKGMCDAYFVRMNDKGKTIWVHSLGGKSVDYATRLAKGTNCIFMAGVISDTVYYDKESFASNRKSLFVASLGVNGKLNWLSRINFTGNATIDVLKTAPDGKILAGGMFQGKIETDGEPLNSTAEKRAYSISLSPAGSILGARMSTGKGDHRLVKATFDTDRNEYLLFSASGSIEFSSTGAKNEKTANFPGLVIQKNDESGKLIWSKQLRCEGYSDAAGIETTTDGFILTANFNKKLIIADTLLTTGAQLATCVASFNKEGKLLWFKVLQSTSKCRAIDLLSTATGSVIITGYFRESYQVDDQQFYSRQSVDNVFLAQFDKNGRLIWHDEPGSEASGFGKTFALDKAGNIIVAGGFTNKLKINGIEMNSSGDEDVLVAKYSNCDGLEVKITGNPLCPGSEVVLSASSGFETYSWNGLSTTDRHFKATKAGKYNVTVYDKRGCSASDTITVVNALIPPLNLGKDTILYPGKELIVDAGSGFSSYNWSDGVTGQQRTISYNTDVDSIKYKLKCETTDGCLVSDSITVKFGKKYSKSTGSSYSDSKIRLNLNVYPNPAKDNFMWWLTCSDQIDLELLFSDVKGSLIYQEEIKAYYSGTQNKIDVSALKPGIYMLKVIAKLPAKDVVITEKIVVQ